METKSIIISVVIILLVLAFVWPKQSAGTVMKEGERYIKNCKCFGLEDRFPAPDVIGVRHDCVGIPYSCDYKNYTSVIEDSDKK